jgi:HSP20 family protein
MNTMTKTEDRMDRPMQAESGMPQHISPRVNIVERKESYLLEAEMPGVSKEGLEISIENNELIIHGKRSEQDVPGTPVYRESRPLHYRRVFDLDPSIDASRITARIEQGLLTIDLPKAEAVKPRKIEITG